MYVLDTNTLIYFFKGMGNVATRLLATSPAEIAIPSVVLFELEFGLAKSTSPRKRRAQLNEICALVELLPFGDKEAKHAAQVRAQLEKKGTPIGTCDLLIAATALARSGILVTNNSREFSRVPNLQVDNWFE